MHYRIIDRNTNKVRRDSSKEEVETIVAHKYKNDDKKADKILDAMKVINTAGKPVPVTELSSVEASRKAFAA